MSKYIDADKLKRHYAWWDDEEKKIFDEIIDLQPAADVAEVVRCRDCKYLDYVDEHEKWCMGRGNPATMVKDEGYCEIGKRKEDFCSNGKAKD